MQPALDCGENPSVALDPHLSAAFDFIREVERAYACLVQAEDQDPASGQEPTLGGKLLYAGALDGAGRALVIAGNIAGAASLAASADPAAQKQAVRDGAVDFLVTSLDEALRILKNEIRKREAVAVCVAVDPAAIEREMLARGVAPDLLRPAVASIDSAGSARTLVEVKSLKALTWLTWTVSSAPARWLPKLDLIALDCLDSNEGAARRWLRLAPRYLGRLANDWRSLRCDREFAAAFIVQVRERVARGEIAIAVEIHSNYLGTGEEYHFSPPESPVRAS
jgi:hypothetical protein